MYLVNCFNMLPYETKELLLKVAGINKSYNVPVLRDIYLDVFNLVRPDVKQGQIVSLVGKSGCGKSTLFRIMAGLESPDSGEVTISVARQRPADITHFMNPVCEGDMGVVFQNSYIYPWRRVSSILKMAAAKNPEIKDNPNEIIDYYVHLFSLEDHVDKYASQLSGGQRQRVAIAEQILNGGDFILLDEPFSGLDSITVDKVTNTLAKIAQADERKTIIIISHDLSNSLAISDTAFILAKEEDKEGATITAKVCLASEGLAWQPDIKENPQFRELLKQVKGLL